IPLIACIASCETMSTSVTSRTITATSSSIRDTIDFTPAMRPTASSIGSTIRDSTAAASAPGSAAVIVTVGNGFGAEPWHATRAMQERTFRFDRERLRRRPGEALPQLDDHIGSGRRSTARELIAVELFVAPQGFGVVGAHRIDARDAGEAIVDANGDVERHEHV